jgi:hypothetical protein
VPDKNLINPDISKWSQGSAGGQWELFADPNRIRLNKRIEVLPNTKYTVKVDGNYDVYVRQFAYEGGFEIGVSQWNVDGTSLTTTGSTKFVGIILRKKDNSAITLSDVPIAKPALALGNTLINIPYKEVNPKPTNITSKKNLVPPLTDPKWFVKLGSKGEIVNEYEYRMVSAGVGVVGYDIPITLKPNTTYTLGATVIGSGARMRLMKASDDTFLINVNPSSPVQTYTTTSLTDYKIRLENNGQAGDYTTKDFYVYEGNIANPVFEPFKPTNPPAVMYPKKNLLPKMQEWTYTNAADKVTVISDYKLSMNGDTAGLYYNQHTFVEKGKTYTVSVGYLTSNARVAIREVKANGSKVFMTNLVPGTQTLTWTPAADTIKIEVDCTTNGTGTMIFENVQLEEGSVATPFEPYRLTNKKL